MKLHENCMKSYGNPMKSYGKWCKNPVMHSSFISSFGGAGCRSDAFTHSPSLGAGAPIGFTTTPYAHTVDALN